MKGGGKKEPKWRAASALSRRPQDGKKTKTQPERKRRFRKVQSAREPGITEAEQEGELQKTSNLPSAAIKIAA